MNNKIIARIISRTVAASAITLTAHTAMALDPGIYQGTERGETFELVVTESGEFSTTAPLLVENGLANGIVDLSEQDSGLVIFADDEDEAPFLLIDQGFFGDDGISLIGISSSVRGFLGLDLISDEAPDAIIDPAEVLLGSWSISLNRPNGSFGFRTVNDQGSVTFNEDGTYETDLEVFSGVSQTYRIEGDVLRLTRSFGVSNLSAGGSIGTRSNTFNLNLGVVTDEAVEVKTITGGFFGRRESRLFNAELTR